MATTTSTGSIHGLSPAYSPSATPPPSEGIEKKLSSITAEQTNAIAKGIVSALMRDLEIDILGNLPVKGRYNVDVDGTKSPAHRLTYASESHFLDIATPIIENKIFRALSIPGNVAEKGIEFLLYDDSIKDSPSRLLQEIEKKYLDPDRIQPEVERIMKDYKLDTLRWVKVMTVKPDPLSSELVFHIEETVNGGFARYSHSTIEGFESDARDSIITI